MSKDSSNIRGVHVSPGIYAKETVLTYAAKNLGITTLGLVGETLRGPAFSVTPISNWREFQDVFGGTSTEKFKESQFPKYELPYVAKSYLSESNQLQVCRVLGISGYEGGPAWVITAGSKEKRSETDKGQVVAVLRSRGQFKKLFKYSNIDNCDCPNTAYDKLVYHVGEFKRDELHKCGSVTSYNENALKISQYKELTSSGNDCAGYTLKGQDSGFEISSSDYGKFTIEGLIGEQVTGTLVEPKTVGYFSYSVSLNPGDKDYILKVLGTTPDDGDAPIYVEALYDVALKQGIQSGELQFINDSLEFYDVYKTSEYAQLEPVFGLIEKEESGLSRKDVGRRFLADKRAKDAKVLCHKYSYKDGSIIAKQKPKHNKDDKDEKPEFFSLVKSTDEVEVGQIYTVVQYTDESGKRHYFYRHFDETTIGDEVKGVAKNQVIDKLNTLEDTNDWSAQAVKNLSDNKYYRIKGDDVIPVTCDMSNYKDTYKFASTPWIVSNVKGDAKKIELNKLFRFHTISDGNNSNNEVKISVVNIRPDEGTFDIQVRQWNDSDLSPIVLERFTRCSLKKNSSNYISYKIGSYDGVYESKSKYITVEVNENLTTQASIPSGFLGYPVSRFDGEQIKGAHHDDIANPKIKYNRFYDIDIKNRKQYFGLSDIVGVDIDTFTYKGAAAYSEGPEMLTQGFHLDSRLDVDSYEGKKAVEIYVDGEKGYKFDCVATSNRTDILTNTPVISTEPDMNGSIYEFLDLRKFTVYFYGGFDGWDIYRNYRSNTDEFKMSKYKGSYSTISQEGEPFKVLADAELLGLNQPAITSDFYAYLAGVRQFANPEETDINVFATPGIDLINNKLLSEEIIEMIEEERADSIYVATTPDKPFGAMDFESDMFSADDVVAELDDTEIDSNYTCTYYPWVKYEDTDNSEYIYLPPTKDVVRNMAMTDSSTAPWFAPAGLNRGTVSCVRAKKITKVGDEDVLYEGRINPVKTFARDGVKIWGQKNLQREENQLNRIHVRRLLLRMRKLISIACLSLIFDPNDNTTKQKFLSLVSPIMDNIKANRGISDYRIEVNDTVESRERRELPAKIYFKPYNSLEYINLEFIVTPENVSFDAI